MDKVYVIKGIQWYSSGDPYIKAIHRSEDSAKDAIAVAAESTIDYWIEEWVVVE